MATPSLARRSTTRSNRRARNLAEKSKLAFSIFLLTIGLAACGQPRVTLPGGTGTPAQDFAPAYAQARAACDSVRTMQAELGLSGRAAGQRMRGRVLAGLVPGALRLEGVAPFGAPVFILVADGTRGTLLLSRERRVVRDARAGGNSERARRHQAWAGRSSRDAGRVRAGRCRIHNGARAYGRRLARGRSCGRRNDLSAAHRERVANCGRALRRARDRLPGVSGRSAVAGRAARRGSEPRAHA